MTTPVRITIAAYVAVLTLGLLAGHWPLEGLPLFGVGGHGLHVGDVVVLAASAIACATLLTTKQPRSSEAAVEEQGRA